MQRAETLSGRYGSLPVTIADFRHLPTQCKFIALMPQWDFLNFLAEQGRRYKGFRLLMQTEANDLIEEGGRVAGVRAQTPDGPLEIRADLVVGCDGRDSDVREKAGLAVETLGAPMDVLWFRLSRKPADSQQTGGVFLPGRIFVTLNRGDYWQCAYVIPKGSLEEVRRRGLEAFRSGVAQAVPDFADRTGEIADWDQVKLLTVAVDRLNRWHKPGAALHRRRRARDVADRWRRRQSRGAGRGRGGEHPGRAAAQRRGHRRGAAGGPGSPHLPDPRDPADAAFHAEQRHQRRAVGHRRTRSALAAAAAGPLSALRRLPARLLGLGFRPEHIRTPERA